MLLLALLTSGCGAGNNSDAPAQTNPAPLATGNINLIFVVSQDLDYHAEGDVEADTANLTGQGLQRSLLMAPFLQHDVLANNNAAAIYALEPTTHLQTAGGYPDMAALEAVQQFAMLNQITMFTDTQGSNSNSGYSYPINTSYGAGSAPGGVAMPSPLYPCQAVRVLTSMTSAVTTRFY